MTSSLPTMARNPWWGYVQERRAAEVLLDEQLGALGPAGGIPAENARGPPALR